MTPAKLAHVVKLATAIAQHKCRTVAPVRSGGWFDGRARTEHAIANPPEYPVMAGLIEKWLMGLSERIAQLVIETIETAVDEKIPDDQEERQS